MVLVDELKKPNIILASISYRQIKENLPLRLYQRKRELLKLLACCNPLYYLALGFHGSFLLEFDEMLPLLIDCLW